MAQMLLLIEAEEERLKMMLTLRRRQLREDNLPMLLPERTFVENFRLGKENFRKLCEDLMPILHPSQRTTAINPEIKILAALEFFATGSYQKTVGNDFSLGLSQTSVSDCLAEVTDALNQPQILRKYITFPRSANERSAVARRYVMQIYAFNMLMHLFLNGPVFPDTCTLEDQVNTRPGEIFDFEHRHAKKKKDCDNIVATSKRRQTLEPRKISPLTPIQLSTPPQF